MLTELLPVVASPSIVPDNCLPIAHDEDELRRRAAMTIREARSRFESTPWFNRVALVRVSAVRAFRTKTSEMVGSGRMDEEVVPRQIAITIASMITTKGVCEIGRHFGGRDHTTVEYAIRKYSAFVQNVLNDMERGAL
jgi:hypothetical protein